MYNRSHRAMKPVNQRGRIKSFACAARMIRNFHPTQRRRHTVEHAETLKIILERLGLSLAQDF